MNEEEKPIENIKRDRTKIVLWGIIILLLVGLVYLEFVPTEDTENVGLFEDFTEGVLILDRDDISFTRVVQEGFYGVEFSDASRQRQSFRISFQVETNLAQLQVISWDCVDKYYDEDSPDYNLEINCFDIYTIVANITLPEYELHPPEVPLAIAKSLGGQT